MLYWKYPKAVDASVCKDIVALATDKWEPSTVNGGGSDSRSSDTVWCNEQWVYDLVFGYMEDANKSSGWNFDMANAEGMQITRYKVGDRYDYHQDGDGYSVYDDPDNVWIHGLTRKLSLTIVLNNEYEGGDFQFIGDEELIREKMGTVIVFPAYQVHRVKPVTSGVRYSLVIWFVGKPFR